MQPVIVPTGPPQYEPTAYLSASIVKDDKPVQPMFRETPVNLKPITAILGFVTLLLAVTLALTAVSAHTGCHNTNRLRPARSDQLQLEYQLQSDRLQSE